MFGLGLLWPIVYVCVCRLKVDDVHEVYYEQSGNPEGNPILILHGGPGGGCQTKYRQVRTHTPTQHTYYIYICVALSLPSLCVALSLSLCRSISASLSLSLLSLSIYNPWVESRRWLVAEKLVLLYICVCVVRSARIAQESHITHTNSTRIYYPMYVYATQPIQLHTYLITYHYIP